MTKGNLDPGEGAGDEREEGLVLALEDVPAVLERGHGGVPRGQRGGVARLQRQEHEVDPHARQPRAQREGRARVQAVRAPPPAHELQPGLLLGATLWRGTRSVLVHVSTGLQSTDPTTRIT